MNGMLNKIFSVEIATTATLITSVFYNLVDTNNNVEKHLVPHGGQILFH